MRSLKEVAVNQSASEWRLIPVRGTIETVLTTLRPTLRRTGCQLNFDCKVDKTIRSEPGAIAQILHNLVLNAVVHAFEGVPAPHKIDVTASEDAGGIRIRVRDNGRGILPALVDTLFLPFVTSRRGNGGSGLGLHLARELAAHKLGGSLELVSGQAGQTEFLLTLPLSNEPAAQQPTPSEEASHG